MLYSYSWSAARPPCKPCTPRELAESARARRLRRATAARSPVVRICVYDLCVRVDLTTD